MPSFTVAAIKEVSAAAHRQFAGSGWRRKAPHLIRESAGVIHGIHFQASQFGSAEEGRFTINLVVTEPRIYQAWTRRPLPANPATAHYPVQQRIGCMLPAHRDHWWEISSSTDLSTVQSEVLDLLRVAESDFFIQFSSLETMLERLRKHGTLPGLHGRQGGVTHGLIAAILGHTTEAETVLRQEVASSTVPGFTYNIREAAKHVGIHV
jgi:hypothetical protein